MVFGKDLLVFLGRLACICGYVGVDLVACLCEVWYMGDCMVIVQNKKSEYFSVSV